MIFAGQKVRASDLNNITPMVAYSLVDVAATSSTTLKVITGLSLPLEAETFYIFEAWVSYRGGAGDLRLALAEADGAQTAMAWSPCGPATNTGTDGVGELVCTRVAAENFGAVGCAGNTTSTAAVAMPRGYVSTVGGSAGSVQMMMAQNTSSATATTVEAGSWMRLMKVPSAT